MYKLYRFNEDRALFGSQLKKTMLEKGYTIDKLIDALTEKNYPVSENTIKKWRSGERIPSIGTLKILADLLGVSMQQLYLPNSSYNSPLSNQIQLILDKRMDTQTVSDDVYMEIEQYFEYLLQKTLFSFLSFSEKRNMDALFTFYKLTSYGQEKLQVDADCSFADFYERTKEYIRETYGKDLPYVINEQLSKTIYADFEKTICFKSSERKSL